MMNLKIHLGPLMQIKCILKNMALEIIVVEEDLLQEKQP